MGEVRERAVGGAAGALELLPDAEVQLRPPQPREPIVERPPHDLVGEATGEPLRAELLDHAASHRLLEGNEQLLLTEAGGAPDRFELELGPGDGGQLEQIRGLRGEAREPLADHLVDAFGRPELAQRPGHPHLSPADLDDPGLEQGAPELADEKGVAAGEVVDRLRELSQLGAGIAAGGAADQIGDLRPGEAREPHSHDVLGAAQVGERLRQPRGHVGLGVAKGREQQQAAAAGGARQVPQHQQRRGIGPVPVLEHHQHRPAATHVLEQVRHRGVEAVALGVGVGLDWLGQLADAGGQVGQQTRQLAAPGPESGAELSGIDHSHELIEGLDEGSVGSPNRRVAGPVENQHAFGGGLGGELARQPALAGAGLAREQRHAAPLAFGTRHQRPQLLQLGRAPDERGDRGLPERARKLRDLCIHAKKIVRLDYSA